MAENTEPGRNAGLAGILRDATHAALLLGDLGHAVGAERLLDSNVRLAAYVTILNRDPADWDAAERQAVARLAYALRDRLLSAAGYLTSLGHTERSDWVRGLVRDLETIIKECDQPKGGE